SPPPRPPASSSRTTAGPPGLRMTAYRRPQTSQPARPGLTDQASERETAMHLVMIGGSDAGISAALRARELDPSAEVTGVVAYAHQICSICGLPYYPPGEVPHWRILAHRPVADLEATGMSLRLDTTARRI